MQPKMKTIAIAAGALLLVPALERVPVHRVQRHRRPASAANKATTWLKTQQLADGSFEVAGFPGFETADAILAIAENAQQQEKWDGRQARDRGQRDQRGNNSAMHAIDDLADSGPNAGQAAKIVVLITQAARRLNPKKFDPDGDGATNLRAIIDAGLPAERLVRRVQRHALRGDRQADPRQGAADTLAYIRSTQEASGGWNFAGDRTGQLRRHRHHRASRSRRSSPPG